MTIIVFNMVLYELPGEAGANECETEGSTGGSRETVPPRIYQECHLAIRAVL